MRRRPSCELSESACGGVQRPVVGPRPPGKGRFRPEGGGHPLRPQHLGQPPPLPGLLAIGYQWSLRDQRSPVSLSRGADPGRAEVSNYFEIRPKMRLRKSQISSLIEPSGESLRPLACSPAIRPPWLCDQRHAAAGTLTCWPPQSSTAVRRTGSARGRTFAPAPPMEPRLA